MCASHRFVDRTMMRMRVMSERMAMMPMTIRFPVPFPLLHDAGMTVTNERADEVDVYLWT